MTNRVSKPAINPIPTAMRSLLALSFLSFALTMGPGIASAENTPKPKTLVELYTSQGCSSCPPANKLLKNYVDRDDVIAISLPVDYWDYLGWKDTYGKSQFSNRQRRFARTRRDGQVYTPQIVANGLNHAVGSRIGAVNNAIRKSVTSVHNRQIPLALKHDGDTLILWTSDEAGASAKAARVKTTVWLALTKKKVSTSVPRGENRGKIVTYYNVVRDLKQVGTWTGRPMKISLPKNHSMASATDGCVVFLQQGPGGPIIGAAEL